MTGDSRSETRDFALRMRLVLGLGNPGSDYTDTYHNAGFRVIAHLAAAHHIRIVQRCGPALVSEPLILGGQAVTLALPQTYMNRSGMAVPPLFEHFQSGTGDLIVIYDDLALPLGKIRIRQKGSAGGHNGLKSIISVIGPENFTRIRVGIGPDRETGDVQEFVLSRVAKTDRILLARAEELAAEAVVSIICGGVTKAMSTYNGTDLRETESEEK